MFSSIITKITGLAVTCYLLTACHTNTGLLPVDQTYAVINAETLNEQQQHASSIIIDARSPDAFNGWVLQNESRGGHIPGAELFSARWITRQIDNLDEAYSRLGLTSQSNIVICGYDNDQAKTVANWLITQKGYPRNQIQVLEQGYKEWIADPIRPVNHLPGYQTLIPPEVLQKRIQHEPSLKVVEIGWDGGEGKEYRKRHIPGAINWDDLEFEHPPIYELNSAETIRESLVKLGVDSNTSVVVYSTESFGAARGATVMKYAGVKNVAILNGGKDAWLAAGLPVQTGWITPDPLIYEFGVSGLGDNRVVMDIDQAKKLRQQKNGALVSIRTWDEYTGKTSGYDYFDKKGRIPGALWGRGKSSTPWNMDDYHNPDGTLRNYQEIKTLWHQWGIYPDTMELSFFCANGWGAAEVWWYAQAMGYKNNTIFSSGSMRWMSDPDNPIAYGNLSRNESILEWKRVSGNLR